jgi:hypothetical protein
VSRLPRLEEHRFVGARDTMRVYDCDQDVELEELRGRIASDDLIRANLIQTFGPDTIDEARNRGFRPV